MPKVFLSHSSIDKNYVRIVARKLGKDNIVYDEFTFEDGNRTLDEIYAGLEDSDIFVLFISNSSLNSKWVKKEIREAHRLLDEGTMKRFFPVMIDSTPYDDRRIPKWIQDYGLRKTVQPSKAAQKIFQKLKIFAWELYPKNKELEQLFIGRYDLKKAFNERMFDFDKPTPISIIISGFKSVGRRKFLLHALKDSNKLKKPYTPLKILLHSRASIEDFMHAIYSLGYTHEEKSPFLLNLMSTSIEKKIDIAVQFLLDIYEQGDKLLVVDNHSIVNSNEIAEWYISLINKLKNVIDSPFLFLVSLSKVPQSKIRNNFSIFNLSILELEKSERNDLFQALLDIENLSINASDKRAIAEVFTGFPDQIRYAVDYIKKEGCKKLITNMSELTEYNYELVSKTIRNYEDNQTSLDLLVLFSHYELIGYSFLEKLFDGLTEEQKILLIDFANDFILEFFGVTGEYIRLNDGIRDYIQRSGLKLSARISEKIKHVTQDMLKDYQSISDYSDFNIIIQEAMVNEYEIPINILIPSHFLLAMRELYNYHNNYPEVIKLADRVLQNSQYFDPRIVREIRYWLCLSLARKRDPRCLREVSYITGVDHNFLLAFYYRKTRRFEDALANLEAVFKEKPNFGMAKRELVQVYLNIEDYEAAFVTAKENYESDKNNPYHIQSYLKCIFKKENKEAYSAISEQLLSQLENSPNPKSKEMFYSCKAQYEAYFLNDKTKAYNTIADGITQFSNKIYTYIVKLEIARKFVDMKILEETISKMEEIFSEGELTYVLPFLVSKTIMKTAMGLHDDANKIIREKIRPVFPERTTKGIIEEIESIKLQKEIFRNN